MRWKLKEKTVRWDTTTDCFNKLISLLLLLLSLEKSCGIDSEAQGPSSSVQQESTQTNRSQLSKIDTKQRKHEKIYSEKIWCSICLSHHQSSADRRNWPLPECSLLPSIHYVSWSLQTMMNVYRLRYVKWNQSWTTNHLPHQQMLPQTLKGSLLIICFWWKKTKQPILALSKIGARAASCWPVLEVMCVCEYTCFKINKSRLRSRQNVSPGDIVMIRDYSAPWGSWVCRKVVHIFPDAKALVWHVLVKTKTNTLDRPVNKLCLICETDTLCIIVYDTDSLL